MMFFVLPLRGRRLGLHATGCVQQISQQIDNHQQRSGKIYEHTCVYLGRYS